MGRIFWQFIGILLLVGFVGAYFWWRAAAAVVSLAWLVVRGYEASLVSHKDFTGAEPVSVRAVRGRVDDPLPGRGLYQRANHGSKQFGLLPNVPR